MTRYCYVAVGMHALASGYRMKAIFLGLRIQWNVFCLRFLEVKRRNYLTLISLLFLESRGVSPIVMLAAKLWLAQNDAVI